MVYHFFPPSHIYNINLSTFLGLALELVRQLLPAHSCLAIMTLQTGPGLSNFTAGNVLLVAGLWLIYQLFKALYNISPLHPLSHIPGPKLASATYLPEFYYDVVKFGCYTKEIRKMHERYGEHIIVLRFGKA
jgi:hypothetical protein